MLQLAAITWYENIEDPNTMRQWLHLDKTQVQDLLNLITPSLSSFMELIVVLE